MPGAMMQRLLRITLVLAILSLAALALATLGRKSFWLDEILKVLVADQATWADVWRVMPADHPPLLYVILRYCGGGSANEALRRIPSAVFGLLTILPMAWLAAGAAGNASRTSAEKTLRRGSERASECGRGREGFFLGASAALLLLVHPLHFRLTQEALPYAPVAFWLALHAVCAVAWMRSLIEKGREGESRGGGSGARLICAIGAALTALAAFATAYAAAFSLVAIFFASGIAAIDRKGREEGVKSSFSLKILLGWLLWAVALAGGMAYMLWRMRALAGTQTRWLFPSLGGMMLTLADGLFGLRADNPATLILFLIQAALVWLGLRETRRSGALILRLCAVWLFLGAGLFLAFFSVRNRFIAPRDFEPYVIPLVILEVAGLAAATRSMLRRHDAELLAAIGAAAVAATAFFVIWTRGVVPDLYEYYHTSAYRETLGDIAAQVHEGESVIALAEGGFTHYCYNYYRDRVFPSAPECEVFDPRSASQAARVFAADRVFLVPLVFGASPPPLMFSLGLRAFHGREPSREEAMRLYSVSPVFAPLPDDGVIDIGRPGDSQWLFGGFYDAESWGPDTTLRWTRPSARVAFALDPPRAARTRAIRIRLFPYESLKEASKGAATPSAPPLRRFEFLVNGRSAGVRECPAQAMSDLEYPVSLHAGPVILTLTTPDPPGHAPGDTRLLSAAIDRIALLEEDAPASNTHLTDHGLNGGLHEDLRQAPPGNTH